MPKLKKKPIKKLSPSSPKTLKKDNRNISDIYKEKAPVWRFGRIDFEGEWGWRNIKDFNIILTIQQRLKNFETMTWNEIIGKEHHPISTTDLSNNAQSRLLELELDDNEFLYSLRIEGKKRLWGIRDNEILYILWYDHEHSVYPVPLKNT
jgi:hypothetical protein